MPNLHFLFVVYKVYPLINPLILVDGIERDITEIDGFDDLHHSEGILLEAQNALSRMYGTRKSFFSVNGSTAGILTAISASVKKGWTDSGGQKLS